MKIKSICALALLFVGLASFSQKTNAPKFGKGMFNLVGKDSSWTMKFATRMQFLSTVGWSEGLEGDFTDPESSFLLRRARLKLDGFAYSPKFRYKIEMALSNRDMSGGSEFTSNAPRFMLDAVVMWNFYGNWELWAGQTKLPGNIERVISSGNLQQVDRSLVNSRYNIDRDVGFQLRHHMWLTDKFLVREKFAFSQGEGRNVTTGNLGGYQYTGRLELLPFGEFTKKGDYISSDLEREETPKLMLSATYDSNQDAVKTRSNLGTYMANDAGFYETDINTFFVDAMFKYNGLSFMGEYAHRSAEAPVAINSDGTETGDIVLVGDGLNLQSGYVFPSNWEISGRYTGIWYDSVTNRNDEQQYTLGLSKYIVGHKLKVQTDLSYLAIDGASDSLLYRLQFEVHF